MIFSVRPAHEDDGNGQVRLFPQRVSSRLHVVLAVSRESHTPALDQDWQSWFLVAPQPTRGGRMQRRKRATEGRGPLQLERAVIRGCRIECKGPPLLSRGSCRLAGQRTLFPGDVPGLTRPDSRVRSSIRSRPPAHPKGRATPLGSRRHGASRRPRCASPAQAAASSSRAFFLLSASASR